MSNPNHLQLALEKWRSDAGYSDEEVSRHSGLSVRALRELHQLGALSPMWTGASGRGAKRAWDRYTIRRAAHIAAVVEAGFSVPVAARIAVTWGNSVGSKDAFGYASAWGDFDFTDEGEISYTGSSWEPFRADGRPVLSTWLTSEWAAGQVDPDHDAYLDIINGEHLVARVSDYDCQIEVLHSGRKADFDPNGFQRKAVRLARLADGGARIIGVDYIMAERPLTPAQRAAFDQVIDGESLVDILKRFYVEGLHFLEGGSRFVDPAFMNIEDEKPFDRSVLEQPLAARQDRIAQERAEEAEHVQNLIATARSTVSINMTLAERIATRKALGLPNGEGESDVWDTRDPVAEEDS